LADLRAVRDQEALVGSVASDATAFRVIDRIASDPRGPRLAAHRARARAWELVGAPEQVTIDLDATLIGAHSDKEGAARTVGAAGLAATSVIEPRQRSSGHSCSPTPARAAGVGHRLRKR
jgi:hypothetical protein